MCSSPRIDDRFQPAIQFHVGTATRARSEPSRAQPLDRRTIAFPGAATSKRACKKKPPALRRWLQTSPPTLMNLPRHNRRLRRIIRRNRNPIVQCSARRHALRGPAASAQEREPCRTSAVNLRARTRTTTRNRQVIFARLQCRARRPAQCSPTQCSAQMSSPRCFQCAPQYSPNCSARQCHRYCLYCPPLKHSKLPALCVNGNVSATPHSSALFAVLEKLIAVPVVFVVNHGTEYAALLLTFDPAYRETSAPWRFQN